MLAQYHFFSISKVSEALGMTIICRRPVRLAHYIRVKIQRFNAQILNVLNTHWQMALHRQVAIRLGHPSCPSQTERGRERLIPSLTQITRVHIHRLGVRRRYQRTFGYQRTFFSRFIRIAHSLCCRLGKGGKESMCVRPVPPPCLLEGINALNI